MENQKQQLTSNSTLQEFLYYLENVYQIQNCITPNHRYQYTHICLDKRCQEQKELFEPLCVTCQLHNSHSQVKENHQVKEFIGAIQDIIKFSFENQNFDNSYKEDQMKIQQLRLTLKQFLCEIKKIEINIKTIAETIQSEYDSVEKFIQENNNTKPQNQLKQLLALLLTQENSKYLLEYLKQLNNFIGVKDCNQLTLIQTNNHIQRNNTFDQQLVEKLQQNIKELQDFVQKINSTNTNIEVQDNDLKKTELFAECLIFLGDDQSISNKNRLFLKSILKRCEKSLDIYSFIKVEQQINLNNNVKTQKDAASQLKMLIEQPNANKNYFFSTTLVVLGMCFEFGYGVIQNLNSAFNYYKMSSDLLNSYGQFKCSILYDEGQGTNKNLELGFQLSQLSAEQNNDYGLNALGYHYQYGEGTLKNSELAFKYYKLSADQGNAYAQNNLGSCYENGIGTQKNIQLAINYYSLSTDQGNERAKSNLQKLKQFK